MIFEPKFDDGYDNNYSIHILTLYTFEFEGFDYPPQHTKPQSTTIQTTGKKYSSIELRRLWIRVEWDVEYPTTKDNFRYRVLIINNSNIDELIK